ncbi:MAG: drug/metabolite transporter (DMT)-like permease [Cocleimonas sp.]|jgi:drug/metabolite transporter (DMT)-like permease
MSSTTQSEQNKKNLQVSGFLFAIAGTMLFSLKSIFIKLAFIEGIDTTTLMFLRMTIAFPFYVAVLVYAIKTRPAKAAQLNKRNIAVSISLGFFGYYLASYLDFESLQHISAQLERLVLFTYPIIVAILSWVFFREKITIKVFISMILSYAGVGFLFFNEAGAGNENLVLGTVLVGSAAFFFSIYVVFSKALISQLGSLIFTSIAMSTAVVYIVIQFVITHELNDLNVSPQIWLLSFLLAIFCTLIPSFLTAEAINRIGATKMSITGSVGPVFTIFIAVIFLGEDFGWEHIVGLFLVLIGVGLLRTKTS